MATTWRQPYSTLIPSGRRWRADTIQIPASELRVPANTLGNGTAWSILNQESDLPTGYSVPAYIG